MPDLLQTEFQFTLPRGFDDDGTLHREGTMRLATAADELDPLCDSRVQRNPPYLTVLLLARVVTKLGTLPEVTPEVVEKLFVADIAHLQELYERVNDRGSDTVDATCPDCGEQFEVSVRGDGTTTESAPHAGNPLTDTVDPWTDDGHGGANAGPNSASESKAGSESNANRESDATALATLREELPESEVPSWE
ncbi:hypothetical protein SAMN04487948_12912 [Halogranum amylolyticum]|uniref:Uncharacterized protein n=1 Tax=Halogranum amylolyticum TaxID=660520 RepID=A0A1H8WFN3_9EURY|nr:phage tail assembly protein [Halogranum amylolyticum]SEP26485.1 hypothetical protein SAMN04487948_12912 [Halogranum amylolyticum]